MDQSNLVPRTLFRRLFRPRHRKENPGTGQDEVPRFLEPEPVIYKPIIKLYSSTMTWGHASSTITLGHGSSSIQYDQTPNNFKSTSAQQAGINSSSGSDLCEKCSTRWVVKSERVHVAARGEEQEDNSIGFRDLFGLGLYSRNTMPRNVLEWKLSTMEQNEYSCSLCKLILMTLRLSRVLERTQDMDAKVLASLESMEHHMDRFSGSLNAVSLTLQAKDVPSDPDVHYIFPVDIFPRDSRKKRWARETYSTTTLDNRRKIDVGPLMRFLDICEDYESCSPHEVDVPGLRVIDVQQGCVISAPPGCHYVALSYVWGRVKQIRLTKETEELLTSPGSVTLESSLLSNVLRDALYFCTLMGRPYLWVDTICIMQDDPTDLATQIAHMDNVYLRASFTIVAAAGSDCNAGLPGLRTERIPKPQMCVGQVDEIEMVGIHQSYGKLLGESVWNTRGWTFQEQVFSRRAFVFTPSLVFFACRVGIMREDCVFSADSLLGVNGQVVARFTEKPGTDRLNEEASRPLFYFGTSFPSERTRARAWELWADLLPQYSRRKFTTENDRINAFKGMLRALEPHLEGFRSGLPKKFFARSLLWYGLRRRQRLPREFPSWSWAAWSASGPTDRLAFQTQNDCVQWTPGFAALDPDEKQWSSSPVANFREPERFGHSNAHDNFREQEHFSCSQNSAVFNVSRDFSHEHFVSKEVSKEKIHEIARNLDQDQNLSHIIFFYTSTVQLLVDRPELPVAPVSEDVPPPDVLDMGQSRCAIRASDGTVLDYIWVDRAWRAAQPDKLTFVALFVHEDRYPPVFAMALTKMSEFTKRSNREPYHPGKYPSPDDCFAVTAMMVGWDHGVARRIGIPEENAFYYQTWLAEKPQFKLIVLG